MSRQDPIATPRTASYEADPEQVHRVLLLYSGGLDTSVMLKWIQDEYGAEVLCLTVNLGQPGEDYEVIRGKAMQLGAIDCIVVDAREEFARDYLSPAIRANALYGAGYPLFTALGRPLIAKLAVEHARIGGCDTIAHGCTGKGNDQVRIEATVATLAPELKVIAPVRSWQMGREEEIAYAREHGIPIKSHPTHGTEAAPYSIDDNLWGRSSEGRWIEDLAHEPEDDVFQLVTRPEDAPEEPEHIELGFERGLPVVLDGERLELVAAPAADTASHHAGSTPAVRAPSTARAISRPRSSSDAPPSSDTLRPEIHVLDACRPFVQAIELLIAEPRFRQVLTRIAVAAVHLDRQRVRFETSLSGALRRREQVEQELIFRCSLSLAPCSARSWARRRTRGARGRPPRSPSAAGLLGPNGAGKTTVFYMITGLIKADRGRIELDGYDVTALPMYQRARLGIGYLPQEASIFRGLNVEENIRAVLEVVEPNRTRREAELDALLEEFNITRLRKTPAIALSGGERRRVEIARALATRPDLHAARRAVRRHRPDRGRRHPATGAPPDRARHRRADHRPQCARDARPHRPRLHHLFGRGADGGPADDIVNNPDVRRLYLGEEFRM